MRQRANLILSILLFVMTFAVPAAASDEDASDWVFDVKIYGWLPDAPAAISISETEVANLPEDVDTILSSLEMAFMGHFTAHKDRLGFFSNIMYYKGDYDEYFVGALGDSREYEVKEKAWLIDYGASWLVGTYKLNGTAEYPSVSVRALAGARFFHDPIEMKVEQGPIDDGLDLKHTAKFNSPIVGLHTSWELSPKWELRLEADYGVYNRDDVDTTYQGIAMANYRFDMKGIPSGFFVGYRYLKIELDDDGVLGVDVEVKGPLFGLAMQF